MRRGRGAWRFRAYGRTIAIAGAGADVERLLRERLPAFAPARATASPDRVYRVGADSGGVRVAVDHGRLGAPRDPRAAAERVVADLQGYLARHARARVFVHAGVVCVGGRAVVIPGRSCSGKSTLVAALAAAGAAYASDEMAVLDRRGRVHPYARPLALRGGGGMRRVVLGSLPGGVVRGPVPVGLVLVPRYRPGARWAPRELSPAQAMLALMRHTLAVRARPVEVLAVLRAVVEHALVWAGVRGEPEEVVAAVLAALRERPPAQAAGAGGSTRGPARTSRSRRRAAATGRGTRGRTAGADG